MARGDKSIDLCVEARIAGSNRRCMLHGWALLRQVDGLRDVASAGWTDEVSPKPGPPRLNSRATGKKCQMIPDWTVYAEVAGATGEWIRGGSIGLQRVKLALDDQGACGSLSPGLECGSSRNFVRMRSSKELTKERTKTMRIFPRLRVFLLVFNGAAMLMTGQVSEAQDRSQGRSMVISRNGILAAESPLAAQGWVAILERGGNAVDAAIATNAMMGVV